MDTLDPAYVRQLIEEQGMTVAECSCHLQSEFGGAKGFSETMIKRFCKRHDIHMGGNSVTKTQLDEETAVAVSEVGGTYGRKLMTGYLASKGIEAAEVRVGQSLQRVQPIYHASRQQGAHQMLNPQSYYAPYFGFSCHFDQNEKMIDYGVTIVAAVDGASGYIVGFSVMPIKNNVTIYRDIMLPSIKQWGLWEQIVADCGKENFLCLYMQHYYRDRVASSCNRPPYKQVKSTKNNRIERFWCEINQRVGYPLKNCLIDMEISQQISKDDPFQLYAMSVVSMAVAEHGVQKFVAAWNKHSVPGKGKPESYCASRQNIAIDPACLLEADAAAALYEQQGALSEQREKGVDILTRDDLKRQRDLSFWSKVTSEIGDISFIFGQTSNHVYGPLQSAINCYLSVSHECAILENE